MSQARRKLLDAAARLFAERGYVRVGINEIIASADVAKATFYQHFPSKEQLCAEWLGEEAERVEAWRRALLDDPRTVRERLEACFGDLLDRLERENFRGCVFATTAAMTDAGGRLRRRVAEQRRNTRDFWRALAGQHESSSKRAKHLGDAWMLLASGAETEARSTRSAWPVKKAKRAALVLGGWD